VAEVTHLQECAAAFVHKEADTTKQVPQCLNNYRKLSPELTDYSLINIDIIS
jgi:hypothetical protein